MEVETITIEENDHPVEDLEEQATDRNRSIILGAADITKLVFNYGDKCGEEEDCADVTVDKKAFNDVGQMAE